MLSAVVDDAHQPLTVTGGLLVSTTGQLICGHASDVFRVSYAPRGKYPDNAAGALAFATSSGRRHIGVDAGRSKRSLAVAGHTSSTPATWATTYPAPGRCARAATQCWRWGRAVANGVGEAVGDSSTCSINRVNASRA